MSSHIDKARQRVQSVRLANLLISKGHEVQEISTKRNRETDRIEYYFFFKNSIELQKEIDKFLESRKKHTTK